MSRESEEKIMHEIRVEQARETERRENPRAQGLVEGRNYRHTANGDVYHLLIITNLRVTKPGWESQVVYHPVGDVHNQYSRPIGEFLEKFKPC